jgi:hypothetical protein
MFTDFMVITLGAISGATASRITTVRRRSAQRRTICDLNSLEGGDRFDEAAIRDAAQQWSIAHGHPEATPLVARKVRLGLHLADQPRRTGRRWVR